MTTTTDTDGLRAAFLVVAYRWGWTNAHQYPVYVGTDRTKAHALAQVETEDRGGKYGCAVYEFNADGTEYERTAYFSSIYDEDTPHRNYRIDMFESLGHRFAEFAEGKVMLPDPDNPGRLKDTEVEVPEWVKDEVTRRQRICDLMTKAQDDRAASSKEGA